jgi:DNA-directed RNA polymerase subunit omega
MNSKLMESALLQVPNPELLVNIVSRRVRQLAQGHRPLIQTDARMDFTDIALKEICDGKLSYEVETLPTGLAAEADIKLQVRD